VNRRLVLTGTALVALAVGVGAWMVLDDGDPPPAGGSGLGTPTVPSTVGERLSEEAEELSGLLAGRARLTYHASYVGEGDAAALGGEITSEEWRDDGRLRRDTRIVTPGAGTAETRTIVAEGEVISCRRGEEEEWTCTAGAAPPEDGDPVLGSVAGQLTGVAVTETDRDEVEGREARCFAFPSPDGEGEVCTTPQGVPLRVAVGATVLRLTALDDDVPPDTFAPPVPVP
jgi:hypothetical protein